MKIDEFINKYKPCNEAAEWLRSLPKNYTIKTAWEECERSDWLMWLLKRLPPEQKPDKMVLAKIAVACAKLALPIFERRYPNDKRPAEAIAAAERWITEPTEENRAAAAYAAAYVYAYAAYAAAYAAADAADAAEKKAERKAQANLIREIVNNPFSRKRKTVPVEVEK